MTYASKLVPDRRDSSYRILTTARCHLCCLACKVVAWTEGRCGNGLPTINRRPPPPLGSAAALPWIVLLDLSNPDIEMDEVWQSVLWLGWPGVAHARCRRVTACTMHVHGRTVTGPGR